MHPNSSQLFGQGLCGQAHPFSIQLIEHLPQLHVGLCICTLCNIFLHSIVSTHAVRQPSQVDPLPKGNIFRRPARQHEQPMFFPASPQETSPKCSFRSHEVGCRRRQERICCKQGRAKNMCSHGKGIGPRLPSIDSVPRLPLLSLAPGCHLRNQARRQQQW